MPVDPVPGARATAGDMLSRWSDGRLPSNLHRVRMPAPNPGTGEVPVRYSLAFFMQADKSATIFSAASNRQSPLQDKHPRLHQSNSRQNDEPK